MTAAENVPDSGGIQDGSPVAGPAVGGPQVRREVKRRRVKRQCVACGHVDADHAEGFIGARIGDAHLCHVDDHSCYLPASWAQTTDLSAQKYPTP